MPSLAIDARPPGLGALRSALAAVRLGAGGAMAGWPVLLGRAVFYVLLMIVLTALWDKVVAERLPGTLVAALPAGGLALYIGVTEWIGLSVPAIHLRLEDDIRSGAVETHLLRPKAYLVQRFAESWGAMLVRMAVTGIAALVMLALSGRVWPTPPALAALVMLGPLGGTVGLLLFTIAGLSAFWVRRTMPAFLILQKMLFLLGGLFAPVTLYPAWLTRLAKATPFAAHMFWPASLTVTPTAAQMADALVAQLLWIGLLASLAALIWRAGLRKVLRGDL
ncbi:MAG TPA: ABC-2 family transporter protein [Caulobacteraceae bacterium]|jgi:ABC-2 type transport system permease protein|nr:ABC-2 family transporter protein [Caulobacteraceae bacterium]